MNRIKSLDGIRAISIIMVLLGHAGKTLPTALSSNMIYNLFANSNLGVRIFFTISGYLITKLLLRERDKTGSIDIKDFYLRRIFRIFPVFYLYIFVILILKWFFVHDIFVNYSLVSHAALYLWNYQHLLPMTPGEDNGYWFLGHFWSLAMEEQFYLLWPLLFIKVKGIRLKKVVIGLILIMPVLRVATYFFIPNSRPQIGLMLHTSGDTILIGCLAALIEQTNFFAKNIHPYLNKKLFIVGVFAFLFVISPILSMKFKGAYNITVGASMNNVCAMILIFWAIYIPSTVANILNSKFLIQIGILSYSLYIWQQLFLNDIYHSWINKFPQNLLFVFVVGTVSYYLIEKPILSLKKRFQKV